MHPLGVHAIPERHQHVVCDWSDGGCSSGTLELAQANRSESASDCRSSASTVSEPARPMARKREKKTSPTVHC